MASLKAVTQGTYRVCPPEDTLARIRPLFPLLGITRLADVTSLDVLGIPVYEAIRPSSRNLVVTEGKGLSPVLAQVSAAMESIEFWHAEDVSIHRWSTAKEPDNELGYEFSDMASSQGMNVSWHDDVTPDWSLLDDETLIPWVKAQFLGQTRNTWVPHGRIELDFTLSTEWRPPLFLNSSKGLASGNTVQEAALYAVYEVLERHAFASCHRHMRRPVPLRELAGAGSAQLVEHFHRVGVTVEVFDVSEPIATPCYNARIWSEDFPLPSAGLGCHLDADAALCRALTEAAQSRLAKISGARDNISTRVYEALDDSTSSELAANTSESSTYVPPESASSETLAEDLGTMSKRIRDLNQGDAIIADLSRPDIGVPVVKVIAPHLRLE